MKKFLITLLILFTIILIAYFSYLKSNLMVVNGYAAKNLCSCVFVAGIDEEVAQEIDLGFSFIGYANTSVNYDEKSTTSNVWGLAPRKAIYREGIGCVLLNELEEGLLRNQTFDPTLEPVDSLANWYERTDSVEIISEEQSQRVSALIAEVMKNDDEKTINSRAMVVLYKGRLIGEGYEEGFDKDSRLLGWSMTKSLTSTMAGLMIRDGYFSLDTKAPVTEWGGTEKEAITYRDLIQMSSGLKFEEDYASLSDANIMLWISDTMGIQTIDNPLEAAPGEKWYYSSGTSNLLMKLMRGYFPDQNSYLDYLNQELFNRIGAYSMIIEPDGSGHFVGSSFGWGTARDWARIGQVYLDSGRWQGEQILPQDWVAFVQQEPKDPEAKNVYGGHFWLSQKESGVASDAYFMNGFHSQMVIIIPSEELVIVRLGVDYNGKFGFSDFVEDLVEVIRAG